MRYSKQSKYTFNLVIALAMLAGLFASTAMATPQLGPAGMDFYVTPSPLPAGVHGDLIRYQPVDLTIPDAPPANAWIVLYRSVDALDVANAVTGTVIIPQQWSNGRVVALCPGTQGMAQSCASSLQLQAGTWYEAETAADILNAGYAVVITDYPGYTTGDTPSYMNGFAEGHAVLDIIKASRQIPGTSLNSGDKVAIMGYSQGGQAAAWTGQLQPSYMPDLNLKGVAAGGVPADLMAVAENIDGKVGAGFLLQVYLGLWAQYPDEIPLFDIVNAEGAAAINSATNMCMFDALTEYMYTETSELTIGNLDLEQLMAIYVDIQQRAVDMKLGNMPIEAPVYLWHGSADPIIPMEQALELRDAYCSMGVKTFFQVYQTAEHVIPMFQGPPKALAWIKDRFDGKIIWPWDSCGWGTRPQSDAQDPTADFIIKLDDWHLDASVFIDSLGQTITVPEESTFSSDCNVSALSVEEGYIDVPTFDADIQIIFPLKAGFTLAQVEPITGDLTLNGVGIMTIDGLARADFYIDGVGFTALKLMPFSVNTSSPVEMPLSFEGPVSALGSGKVQFAGDTIIPPMEGGLFAPLFSALMSGPMSYSYRVSPNAPWMY